MTNSGPIGKNSRGFASQSSGSVLDMAHRGVGGAPGGGASAGLGQCAADAALDLVREKMNSHFLNRLAVCSWSLQPKSPEELIEQVQQIGVKCIQLALDPLRENPDVWGKTRQLCNEKGLILVSGMFGTAGEDYTMMETIKL